MSLKRRGGVLYIVGILFLIFFFSWILLPSTQPPRQTPFKKVEWPVQDKNNHGGIGIGIGAVPEELLNGEGIMPKLGNETLKGELGRASWKLFHTMLARYPLRPTDDEREALRSYIYLFARLYPCGECSTHFRGLLKQYPPQTSSRDAASQWGCFVHNQVNERLQKPLFDCTTVTETYKCGCADTDKEDATGAEGGNKHKPTKDLLGPLPEKTQLPESTLLELKGVKLETEGLTRGG